MFKTATKEQGRQPVAFREVEIGGEVVLILCSFLLNVDGFVILHVATIASKEF